MVIRFSLPSGRKPNLLKDRAYPRTFRIVFEENKPIVRVGFGEHTCIEYELTWDQLRGMILDAMPELLKR